VKEDGRERERAGRGEELSKRAGGARGTGGEGGWYDGYWSKVGDDARKRIEVEE